MTPDRDARPETLWCGIDPGALFRSDDGGEDWFEVKSLTQHPTRERWQPGAGGMMVHSIVLDPDNPRRMYVGISAAGCFRTEDDGQTWQPLNQGVRADFLPDKFPEVGQCVHRMKMDPKRPEVLYQQNHCGVYRSDNGAASWKDISKGLPSRFGFPIAIHPHEPGTIFVVPEVSPEYRFVPDGSFCVWRSRNGGKTWQKLTRGLPQKNAFLHVMRQASSTDTCDDTDVYVGTTSGEVFYSHDNGDSWELLQSHLPAVLASRHMWFRPL